MLYVYCIDVFVVHHKNWDKQFEWLHEIDNFYQKRIRFPIQGFNIENNDNNDALWNS